MTNVDYRKEEQRIHNARATAIADLDKHLSACGLSVDQRNKAMDLLVPILAHVNALADFNQRMNLEAMRDELRPLATLLKKRMQIVAKREDSPKQTDAAFDNGQPVPLFDETQSPSKQHQSPSVSHSRTELRSSPSANGRLVNL